MSSVDLAALAQEATEATDGRTHAGDPQRAPEGRLVAGKHRLAELPLERVEHTGGRQSGSADQDRVGGRRLGVERERPRALLRLVVDVDDTCELSVPDELESRRGPPGLSEQTDRLRIRRREGEPFHTEMQ